MVEYKKYVEQLKAYKVNADFKGMSERIEGKLSGGHMHSLWLKPAIAGVITAFLCIVIFNVYLSSLQKKDLLSDYVFEGTGPESSMFTASIFR